jgi:ABC-type polysaccharide/polyol phosphate export permease
MIYPLIARCLFYTSPVIIPLELMPKPLFDAQSFNPLAPIIVQIRPWLIDPSAPGWFETGKSVPAEILPFVIFIGICVAGWVVFTRKARYVSEEL